MIVVDASAMLESLLQLPASAAVEAQFLQAGQALYAPHVIDLEIAQTLRLCLNMGMIDNVRAEGALSLLANLRLYRCPHDGLMPRIWALRNNLTAFDAAYVGLAESLDVPLLTRDVRLAAAPGHHAKIILV